jgi:hypothetical protein
MDLTTVTRVKATGQGFSGTDQDTLLAQIVAQVSAAAEKYMDRGIEYTSRTEYFNIEPGQTVVRLHAFPAIANVAVYNDTAHQTGSYTQFPASTQMDASQYGIDTARGLLIFDQTPPQPGANVLKVTYTGGMSATATSAANFIAAFPDIASALDLWAVYVCNQAKQPGVNSVSIDGASAAITVFTMPTVTRDTLNAYRTKLGTL